MWVAAKELKAERLMDPLGVDGVLVAAEPWAVSLASYLVALEFPPLEIGAEEGESRLLGRLMGVTPLVQVGGALRIGILPCRLLNCKLAYGNKLSCAYNIFQGCVKLQLLICWKTQICVEVV
jgi:hypothetical protein